MSESVKSGFVTVDHLAISDSLLLPPDAVTQKLALLGRTGSGKTYAATKLAELMLEVRAQIIALDPVGVWYGLRTCPDFSLPIFGGLHGDLPLEKDAGEFIADLIVDRGISAVLDVSQLLSAEQARFAYDFATRFFHRKKSSPSAVHLFVEECQEFVPQNISGGSRGGFEARMLGAFERLIKLGRNFGIGASLISQRPQEVNKKALNQAECLFAFQMTGPQERKTVADWISGKAGRQEVIDELPRLEVGRASVWSPQWLGIHRTVKIAKKRSADVSSTPTHGARKTAEPKRLSAGELGELAKQMSASIEKAKSEDPKELRKRIHALERELASKKTPPAPATVKVPAIGKAELDRLDGLHKGLTLLLEGHERRLGEMESRFISAIRPIAELVEKSRYRPPAPIVGRPSREAVFPPFKPGDHPIKITHSDSGASIESGGLGKGERRIAIAIAQHGDCSREQLTVLTGYKRSTRNAYIQRLVQAGLVIIGGGDRVFSTGPKLDIWLGDDYEELPTGEALQRYWIERLPKGESDILRVVLENRSIDREQIGELTGYKRSTRNAYLQRLGARELVQFNGSHVEPSPDLFPEETRISGPMT